MIRYQITRYQPNGNNNSNLPQYKVIAFDFDQTIICCHSIMADWTPQTVERMTIPQIVQVTSPLFNNPQFLQYLKMQHQTNGARFVVTSYGSKPVIEAFLRRLGILYLFDAVMTPSVFGLLDGYNVFTELNGKNVMLERIATHYGISQSQILLLDDSPGNINTAKASKYPAVQVNPTRGLTISEGYIIEKFLRN